MNTKIRTTIITLIAAGSFATATVAPAVSQAQGNVQSEAAICYYAGVPYSEGAKITLQDGTVQTCQHDGTWGLTKKAGPVVTPPTGGLHIRLNA
jgi:Protein of unknown function (DUF1496)